MRRGQNITCINCGVSFYVAPNRLKTAKACSVKCICEHKIKHNTTKIKSACPVCNKEIKTKLYHRQKTKGILTCSRECRGKYIQHLYQGENNPNFKYKTILEEYFARKLQSLQQRKSCSLTVKDLVEQYKQQNGLCYYSGLVMKLMTESFQSKGQADPDVLSVDRLDNKKGYHKDNIVFCCNALNKMRGNNSHKQVEPLLMALGLKAFGTCIIKFKRLRDNATLPFRANLGDGGYDLTAAVVEDLGNQIKIYTGIAVQPTEGWVLLALPRSSIYKKQLQLSNSIGLIDNKYTGEICAYFDKLSKDYESYKVGERCIQLFAVRYPMIELEEVSEFETSERESGGFGSTGA